MKTKYFLTKHQRGNHSAAQVYNHGTIHFKGTKKECQQDLILMRKYCKDKYAETSTNDKLRDFIRYEMADIFFVKKTENEVVFA